MQAIQPKSLVIESLADSRHSFQSDFFQLFGIGNIVVLLDNGRHTDKQVFLFGGMAGRSGFGMLPAAAAARRRSVAPGYLNACLLYTSRCV